MPVLLAPCGAPPHALLRWPTVQAALLALRAGQDFKLRLQPQQPTPPGSPGSGGGSVAGGMEGAAGGGGPTMTLWFRPAETPELQPHQPAIGIPAMPGPGRASGGDTPPSGGGSFELMPGTPSSAADRPASSKGRPAYYFAILVAPHKGSAAAELQEAPAPPEPPALARRASISCEELPPVEVGCSTAGGATAGSSAAPAAALRRVSMSGAPRRNSSFGSLQSGILMSQVRRLGGLLHPG